jgi:hypothetical protein
VVIHGDSLLAEFESVVDAVQSRVEQIPQGIPGAGYRIDAKGPGFG